MNRERDGPVSIWENESLTKGRRRRRGGLFTSEKLQGGWDTTPLATKGE